MKRSLWHIHNTFLKKVEALNDLFRHITLKPRDPPMSLYERFVSKKELGIKKKLVFAI
jgi:hypothetical protein